MRFLFALSLLSSALAAQVLNGRIEIRVADTSGAAVANARISLKDARRQIAVAGEGITDTDGAFLYASLRPSIYEVTIEANGFRKAVLGGLELNASATLRQTVKLELGALSEAISVEANAISVNNSDAQIAKSLNLRDIDTLPQLGRSPLSLLVLTPGVSIDPGDQSFSRINGLRQGSNNTKLDGIDANDSVVPRFGLSLTPVNTDSLEEVRIVTNGGKAEYGRNAGGQVEMVTRSGTNQFHGNVFDYLRNTALNANTFFSNSTGTPRPKFIQNIYGGSIGGPIFKDKLFFFANYQGRNTVQEVVRNRTVATDSAKLGLFRWRDAAGAIQSYDIAANDPAGRGVDPGVRSLFALMPAPNNTDVGDGLNSAGYRLNLGSPAWDQQGTAKVDYQLSPLHRIFYRHTEQRAESVDSQNNAERTYLTQQDGKIINNRYGFSIGSDWTIRPTLINEFRAGRQYSFTDFLRPDRIAGPTIVTITYTDPFLAQFSQGRNAPVNDFTDNVTKSIGKHTIKTGFNFRSINQYGYNYNLVYPNVNLAKVNGNTAPAALGPQVGQSGITGNVRATFENIYNDVLGRAGQVQQTFYSNLEQFQDGGTPRERNLRFKELGLFLQDDWKIGRNLTLNFGLRWEYLGPPVERDGFQGTLNRAADINTYTNIADARVVKTGAWFNRDFNNFAPRFGFAWDPEGKGKTSIRGSYGVFFDRAIGSAFNTADGSTPGFAQTVNTFPNAGPGANVSVSTLSPAQFPQKPGAPALSPALDRQTSVVLFTPNLRTGYVQHFNFNIQRELSRNTVLDVGFVRTLGVKLLSYRDINQLKLDNGFLDAFKELQAFRSSGAAPSAANPLVRLFGSPALAVAGVTAGALDQGLAGTAANTLDTVAGNYSRYAQAGISDFFLRNLPQFNQAVLGTNDGLSNYNALQVSFARSANGLKSQVNYTYSKTIDNTSEEGNGFAAANSPLDSFNLRNNRARGTFDRPHSFNFYASYALPFGRGRLLGGWEIGTLGILQSGKVFTVISGRRTAGANAQFMPDYIGDRNAGTLNKAGGGVFYFSAAEAANFSPAAAGTIGTAGRNAFRGPGFFNMDVSAVKPLRITERFKAVYRLEMYNMFNHANFDNPNLNFSVPAAFGRITTLVNGTSQTGARVMQMALRVEF